MFRCFLIFVFLFLIGPAFSEAACDSCSENNQLAIKIDTVVIRNAVNQKGYSLFAINVKKIRDLTSNIIWLNAKGCDSWTISTISDTVVVAPGITAAQATLAVKRPNVPTPLKDGAVEKFGGFGWLFKVFPTIIYCNRLEEIKIVSHVKHPEISRFPSWKMLILVLLILFFSVSISFRLFDKSSKPDNQFGAFAYLSLLLCLFFELTMLNPRLTMLAGAHSSRLALESLAASTLLAVAIYSNILIMGIILFFGPIFKKNDHTHSPRWNKEISLQLSIWALFQLCCLIGFLAGWLAFVTYLIISLILLGCASLPSVARKISEKHKIAKKKRAEKKARKAVRVAEMQAEKAIKIKKD